MAEGAYQLYRQMASEAKVKVVTVARWRQLRQEGYSSQRIIETQDHKGRKRADP